MCSIGVFLLWSIISPRSSRATDWLPIAPEDLALKDNPKQPGADAMILYRELIDDASKAVASGDTAQEYVRIKVFTQAGTQYGHVEIEFEKSYQNVVYIAGRTIKPDGTIVKFDGQVLETVVEKSSGRKILAKTFTLPDVQPGCIIEYKYQLQGDAGWVHSHEWRVSKPIYTREAHFTYIPDSSSGNDLRPMCRPYLLPSDAVPKEQPNGTYLMVVHDIPGVVEEPLMPPERLIEARVQFYYQDSDAPSTNEPSDRYWDHYGKKLNADLEHFIDKKNALNQDLTAIINPNDSPEVKLRKIYARVQRIRNLDLEDYKTKKETKDENIKKNANVEDILKHGYATSTQIDYLFVGLARAAGFEAAEVWIAPRNVELFLPKRNEIGQLSDEITWVRADSKEYYLDPGARFFPFGLLPWYETGTGGIRVDKKGAAIVDTPFPVSTDGVLSRTADIQVTADGSISGTLQVDVQGQEAGLLREEKRTEDEVGRTKDIESEVKGWLPVNATFEITKLSNWEDNTQAVHIEGTLKIPSLGSSAGRRMIMPLELFGTPQMASFTPEKRVNVVYFHYPFEEIDDIKLHLQAGYKAGSLPPDRKINLGAVSYEISAAGQDSTVEVKRHLVVSGVLFTKEQYGVLRSFFGTVKTNDNAQMVLQDAQSAKNN